MKVDKSKNEQKNQSVIAFGAHPDDLEIGMGGTLAKLARMDYDVNWS